MRARPWFRWAAVGFLPLPSFVSCQRAPEDAPAGAVAADEAAPAGNSPTDEAPAEPEPREAPPVPESEVQRRERVVAEHPSWAYYPAIDPRLVTAVADRERADVVLRLVADTLAPFRWASLDDWDNTGFINLEPDSPAGWVTRSSGSLASQLAGEYQLGCAGGYLEGVRAVLVPDLGMADLKTCDAGVLALLGDRAPAACPPETFGLVAIAATADAATRRGVVSAPPKFVHVEPSSPDVFDDTLGVGTVSACTVSHRARAFGHVRYYHHLMLVVRPGGRPTFQVFDTTGYGGVQVREMTSRKLASYSAGALAMNRKHDYDPATAHVDCFAINRRR